MAGAGWIVAIVAVASTPAAVWLGRKWWADRTARKLAEDVAAGRFERPIAALVEEGRLVEAASLEERRQNFDRAAALLEQAGDPDAAASVYRRAGQWSMAALTLREAGRLVDAADIYRQNAKLRVAAELYEQAGEARKAADTWRAAGEPRRALAALGPLGHSGELMRARAELAVEAGAWTAAAEAFEALGENEQAIDAWKKANRPEAAARLQAEAGDHAAAAAMMVEAGNQAGAAEAYARAGEYRKAARAAWRAGDAARSIELLQQAGDQLGIARVLLATGRRDAARKALREARPGHKTYAPARELLASLELEAGHGAEARTIYAQLALLAIERGKKDADTRRWLVSAAQLALEAGDTAAAVQGLERIEELGLMTDPLRERLNAVRGATRRPVARPEDKAALGHATTSLLFPRHERYVIEAQLSRGAFGVIYRAHDHHLDRDVVIKMIAAAELPTDIARRWFLREARVAAKLNHPNVVTIHDIGEMDHMPFIAMELVKGRNLGELMSERGPMTLREILPLYKQLLSAVDHAHREGIVHRDIKLANIMLTEDGVLKLMDFGFAKAMQSPDQSTRVRGTPWYISPEQSVGIDVDHRTDLYALGVLLFRLLTGAFPYPDGNVVEQHRRAPIPDPRHLVPELGPDIAGVIRTAMAKRPDDRFSSAREMAQAMRLSLRSK